MQSKRDAIATELQQLEREGVIEKTDASLWISNMFPAPKKDGAVRVCINLSNGNIALYHNVTRSPRHRGVHLKNRRQRGFP